MARQKTEGGGAEQEPAQTLEAATPASNGAAPAQAAAPLLYVYPGPYRTLRAIVEEQSIVLTRGVPIALTGNAAKVLGAKVRQATEAEIAALETK